MKNKKTHLVLWVIYLLWIASLVLYLMLSGNEYAWMHEIDAASKLPQDDDLLIKKVLFGIPVIVLAVASIIYAFTHQGKTYKTISMLVCVATVLVLLL
jgi:small-conductance mechanosensitive channel